MDPNNPLESPGVAPIGDKAEQTVYTAVGSFLTAWEYLEVSLGGLFAVLVSGRDNNRPAERAYSSVKTFQGRADMIEEAGRAFFDPLDDGSQMFAELKQILNRCRKGSARRNEIAHGLVFPLETTGWAVQPALYGTKRDLKLFPLYAYTSEMILQLKAGIEDVADEVRTAMVRIRDDVKPSLDRREARQTRP